MSKTFSEEIESNRHTIGQFFACLKHTFERAVHDEQLTVLPDLSRCLAALQQASAEDLACTQKILRYVMRECDYRLERRGSVHKRSSRVPSIRGGNRSFRRRKFMRSFPATRLTNE